MQPVQPPADQAAIALGERLFLETRFAQFFYERCRGDVNVELATGDPTVEKLRTTGQPIAGPFAGLSMNCRVCHLVNEFRDAGPGVRTYADFARRSPIPPRSDGKTLTARNAPAMVNATIPRTRDLFLHFDGEFPTGADLVKATFTGRNFGWLPREHATAVRHIAKVVREDDGTGGLAREFGGPYARVFLGEDPTLPDRFWLPSEFRLDVRRAADEQIFDAVARLVAVYMDSLFFSRDEMGEYDGSPYDAFLETNRLPRQPDPGQSTDYYLRHLKTLVVTPPPLRWIEPTNAFRLVRNQTFQFGAEELAGMKIFFATPRDAMGDAPKTTRGVGNCVACHTPPDFTDFQFHNTGATQDEYDALHGAGRFLALRVPDLTERNADIDRWLPPTSAHPDARGPFLAIPTRDQPGRTDLGLWNVFANPDHPRVQTALRRLIVGEGRPLPDEELLPRTVAQFKTPSVRGLAMSAPYLHTGHLDTLEDVIRFYIRSAELARAGKLRNPAPELLGIRLSEDDVAPLAAFLRSLNEDYE